MHLNLHTIFCLPSRWLQGADCQTLNGQPVSLTPLVEQKRGPEAKKFSLQGAVAYHTRQESPAREATMDRLRDAIAKYKGRNVPVAEFNNSPETKWTDILAVMGIYRKGK